MWVAALAVDPEKMKGGVDLGGWLYQDGLPKDSHPSKYYPGPT